MASHKDGAVHAQQCWAEGHHPNLARLERLSLPAGHAAVCSRVARGTAVASRHARVTLCQCSNGLQLALSRCVTESRSAFPEPGLLTGLPLSPGPRAGPQGLIRGQPLQQGEPWGCSGCCMPSAPNAHEPAQLSKVPPFAVDAFRCGVPSSRSILPSPFAWKRRSRRGISYTFGI